MNQPLTLEKQKVDKQVAAFRAAWYVQAQYSEIPQCPHLTTSPILICRVTTKPLTFDMVSTNEFLAKRLSQQRFQSQILLRRGFLVVRRIA
jgi:hypothetical protein